MSAGTISIRRGDERDAEMLAAFGERTFRDAFEAGNNPDDINVYAAETYAVERQRADLVDPARHTLIAELGGMPVAYAQLRRGYLPECVTDPGAIELLRFYVDQRWHGKGIAQTLMTAVVDAARALGARTLWLGVWQKNGRAIAFYEKMRFRHVGEHEFVMGSDRQMDWVMIRPLESEGSAA